jgi:hypothetical protein
MQIAFVCCAFGHRDAPRCPIDAAPPGLAAPLVARAMRRARKAGTGRSGSVAGESDGLPEMTRGASPRRARLPPLRTAAGGDEQADGRAEPRSANECVARSLTRARRPGMGSRLATVLACPQTYRAGGSRDSAASPWRGHRGAEFAAVVQLACDMSLAAPGDSAQKPAPGLEVDEPPVTADLLRSTTEGDPRAADLRQLGGRCKSHGWRRPPGRRHSLVPVGLRAR